MTLLRRAGSLFAVHYAEMLAYRAEIFLWALSTILPFILMGVWVKAGESGGFALSGVQFAQYFLAVFLTRQLSVVWVVYLFEEQVVKGTLSSRLLQPLDPVWHHVTSHVAERFARLPALVLMTGLFFVLYPEASWWPGWGRLLVFFIAANLAFALRFLMQYTFAMLTFWSERASSIEHLWYLLYVFLSGLIAPLDVYPDAVRQLAEWTPFPYVVFVPAQLLVGMPVDVGHALVVMGGWAIGVFALNRLLWRRGLMRYSGMGA